MGSALGSVLILDGVVAGSAAFGHAATVFAIAGAALIAVSPAGAAILLTMAVVNGGVALVGAIVAADMMFDAYHQSTGTAGWSPIPQLNIPQKLDSYGNNK